MFLDYLPRGGARRAPELQHVPTQLVGQAENAGDDRVGGVFCATAEHQTPQPQHVLARLSSIRGPRAARRSDIVDEFRTSGPVYSICPATTTSVLNYFGVLTGIAFDWGYMLVWLIANHEHVTCFNRKKVRDWAASAQRRGSNVDLAARAEAQAETTESRCGGCLCCCGPRPDVLVEHEAQREARIAAHRGVLPGLEAGDA